MRCNNDLYLWHTIASNDKELVIIGDVVGYDVGVCSDNLLFWRKLCALFELKVTNGTRQSKVAIDSAKIYEASSCAYPRLLSYYSLAMVKRS